MPNFRLVLAGFVCLVLATFGLPAWADEPTLDIPGSALKATLEPAHVKQIDAFTAYWADKMSQAATEDAVVLARAKILDAYTKYDSAEYQYTFAQEAAKALLPVLDVKDPKDSLKNLRQANAAMAIAKMPQATILPSLEKMVSRQEDIIRLYGWKGFYAIRTPLLGQGKDKAKRLIAALSATIEKENSGLVLATMFDVLNFGSLDMTSVGADVQKFVNEEGHALMRKGAQGLCYQIANDGDQFSRAGMSGMYAAGYYLSVFPRDAAKSKALLQMVADTMWCAATAFDKAKTLAEKSEGKIRLQAEFQADGMNQALRTGEEVLNGATNKKLDLVAKELSDTTAGRGPAVLLAVASWAAQLKPLGIVQPIVPQAPGTPDKPAPTTTPK